jgi:hypothetical protein
MSEYRGIEVFGRSPRRRSPRRATVRIRRRSRVGLVGLLAAAVTATATTVGIALAMAGKYEPSILLAYLATGASVVAVLCGAAAVVTGRGRLWGAIALVLGIVSSPPVLTRLLGWASGLG